MDSLFKAWQLAVVIYFRMKQLGVLQTGFDREQIENTQVFNRIGTDSRTKEKYWNMLLKEGYLIRLGNGKYTVIADIETRQPKTLNQLYKEARKEAIQTTLEQEQDKQPT